MVHKGMNMMEHSVNGFVQMVKVGGFCIDHQDGPNRAGTGLWSGCPCRSEPPDPLAARRCRARCQPWHYLLEGT